MSFSSLLKKIFGSKADRDLKELNPILDKILESYKRIDALTDDQLRAESARIKGVIRDYIAEDESKKKELRAKLEDLDISADEKEKLATEVDKLAKKIDSKIEEVLMQVLPDAFAVMKSTARRFKENPTITVTATEADRELAAGHDFVTIEGDMAVW